MYVYSCNALSAQFFAVDRALNSYFMITIMTRCQLSLSVCSLINLLPLLWITASSLGNYA